MSSRKCKYSLFTVDDSDDELGFQLIREEQNTFDTRKNSHSSTSTYSLGVLRNGNELQARDKFPVPGRQASLEVTMNDETLVGSSASQDDLPDDSFELESDSSSVFEELDSDEETSDEEEHDPVLPKRQRYKSLDDFRELRVEFLQQFMRTYCPKGDEETCMICSNIGASLSCLDCFHYGTRCQACILKEHRHLLLHRIQYFDGFTWQSTTLRDLGLVVYLGHYGDPCPVSSKEFREEAKQITVIDMKGIQEVNVLFCSCDNLFGMDAVQRSQLLNHRWYPATTETPRTVATFSTLDTYEALSGEGKLSGYHFYRSLVRLNYDTSYEDTPKRYEEILRMTREYQHLKMVQRAGKLCSSDDPLTIEDGQLAVECPACPHPGKNLPDDWDKRVDSWIYTLFIMIDGNFKLKSKKKRSVNDLDLGGGKSYFVKDEPYKEFLKDVLEEKEIKYCDSGLRAVDQANVTHGKGYNASGVVGVQCRHMLFRSNGVGDLQKGKKFANVDYIVLSSLKNVDLKRIVMSYDIACQYSRNFAKRMSKFHPSMQLDMSKISLGFVIPQFHIAGHGDKCRTRYNLRFRQYVGRTDGKNIERGWASLNPLSMASKEMGPGSRVDYLDWHIGDWNHQRILTFGQLFPRKLKEAVVESVKQTSAMMELRKGLPKGLVNTIEASIRQWDKDTMYSPDPFAEHCHGTSTLQVRKMLVESELREERAGELLSEYVSATHWIMVGLELEESQSNAKRMSKSSTVGKAEAEKNVLTLRKLRDWKNKQLIHMPRLSESYLWDPMPEGGDNRSTRCWTIRLNLPSSIAHDNRDTLCPASLAEKEFRLRIAQCEDSLEEVRRLIQRQWWLGSKRKQHVIGPGQKNLKKSNLTIQSVSERRDNVVDRYRRARLALVALKPGGSWQTRFRVLRKEDLRPMEDDEGKGEGRRIHSWIWTVGGATSHGKGDQDIYEGLKVEYAKSQARATHWLEEVQLLKEEMRHIIHYFNWKIEWWLSQITQLKDHVDEVSMGFVIYGNRQVLIIHKIAQSFRQRWIVTCNVEDLPDVRTVHLIRVRQTRTLPIFVSGPGASEEVE